jgi:hypoxanthine phosphoribosyltransferase
MLVVMNGGLPFAAELLKRFAFALEYGYLHVGRYGSATRGGELRWHVEPDCAVAGRTVLVVDDVLDQGETLAAIRRWAVDAGAAAVVTCVLVDKAVAGSRPLEADHAALVLPDRYLFGCGMDYRGYWRNLPGIYALPEAWEDDRCLP